MFQLNVVDPQIASGKNISSLLSSSDNLESFRVYTTVIWIHYANLHILACQYFQLHVSVASFRAKEYWIRIFLLERISSLPPYPFLSKSSTWFLLAPFFQLSFLLEATKRQMVFKPLSQPHSKTVTVIKSLLPPAHLQRTLLTLK